MRKFVFAVIENNAYDIESIFEDSTLAVELAISGKSIAVLDALSLEYYGSI